MSTEGTEAVRVDAGAPQAEEMPSLASIATEPGDGAWPAAWYAATILPGFASKGGKQFQTEDTVSKAGDSRNLVLTLAVTNAAGKTRNMFTSRNYRTQDLNAETVARVKAGTADKRTQISLGKLGQIETAIGFAFKKHPEGGYILVAPLVGQRVDIRLGMEKAKDGTLTGFNEVTDFAKAGTKVRK